MALPPAFQGIDFSQWQTWPDKVIDGIPYKTIPGQGNYVFDPNSGAHGTIRLDPTEARKYIASQQPKPPGLGAQAAGALLPTVATVGGLYAGKKLFDYAGGLFSPNAAANAGASAAPSISTTVAGASGETVSPSLLSQFSLNSTAASQPTGVGSALNGGTLMSDGSVAGAPSGFSLSGIGAQGNYFAPAAGAVIGGDMLLHDRGIGSDVGRGAASGALIGSYFGVPWAGAGIGAGVGLLRGLGNQYFSQPSTRDIAKKHTSELLNQGKDDQAWQQYAGGMRQQFNAPPPDPEHPFAGKYSTFDEYKTAGLQADNLTGVYGNLKTYGPDWAKLTEAQRQQVTQANINDGLYDSKKGEVIINDQNKAKQNYDSVINGAVQPNNAPTVVNAPSASTVAAAENIPGKRTKTLSPGIGLDGRRLFNPNVG